MLRSARGGRAPIHATSWIVALVSIAALPHRSIPNASDLPPTVAFVEAPDNGEIVPYRLSLFWTGSDPDSGDAIHHFEVAIDPPGVFTSAEIAHPETAPGVMVSVRPGPDATRDTIEVSKNVADSLYSFFWIGTSDTSTEFVFGTPNPDSVNIGGQIVPTITFSGSHRVFLRGMDLEETFSETDSIDFVARNITPSTTITYPNIAQEIYDFGPKLLLEAEGVDADTVSQAGQPVGFMVNVLRLDTMVPPRPILAASPSLLFQYGDWIYYPEYSLSETLNVATPAWYILGVRAVDENGGIEPWLELGRNTFKFQAFPAGGKPDLTIREPNIGSFDFRGMGLPKQAQVPAAKELYFTWTATAEAYGGLIDAYSWGLDIPFPELEGPGSGWSDWGPITAPPVPLIFPSEGTHTLYVRARDRIGSITTAQLVLQVLHFAFDREVLIVDDCFDNLDPDDAQHDAFWQEMVSFYVANSDIPAEQFFVWSVHGDGDRGNLQPNAPPLSELARYKILVWENHGAGYNTDSALIRSTALSPSLTTYLRAGGKLWLGGRMTVGATTPSPILAGADLTYPKTELGPGDWAWDFLKLQSSEIRNDKGTNNRHRLHSVWPMPLVPAVYDSMVVDINKLPLLSRTYGGFTHSDAVWGPIFAEAQPDFQGDIDTVYAYGAAGDEVQATPSQYHGRLCAIRWHDPDPAPVHGRVQWFGFAMYFMQNSQAQQTFKASLDWLRLDDIVVPVRGLSFTAFREETRVVVRWDVSDETRAFQLYRQEPGHSRERIDARIFSGESHYRHVDGGAPSGPVDYWLAELGRTGVQEWHGPMAVGPAIPMETRLRIAVHPNPVLKEARIDYNLPRAGHVEVTVHDISGRRIQVLVDQSMEAGPQTATWNPRANGEFPSGFYVVRLHTPFGTQARKVLVLP